MTKYKEFNLDLALAGHPLITKNGDKVLSFHYFNNIDNLEYPICAVIKEGKNICIETYSKDGIYLDNDESGNNLMLAPTKKTYWVNVYKDWTHKIVVGEIVHLTMEDAMDTTKYRHEKIKTISFEVEE